MAPPTQMKIRVPIETNEPVESWLQQALSSDLPRTRKLVCACIAWMAHAYGNPIALDRHALFHWTGYRPFGGDWRALMAILDDLDRLGWIRLEPTRRRQPIGLELPLREARP